MRSFEYVPVGDRVTNAVVSYVAYIRQMVWPAELACLYPHSGSNLPAWKTGSAAAMLLTVTATVFAVRRRRPYLLVGWLWYLGMLVPVIGLIQVGRQARADRYTYLPQIGLVVALTWWVADLLNEHMCRDSTPLGGHWSDRGPFGVLLRQARHWHDGASLFSHALACTSRNLVMHNNLGACLENRGQLAAAAREYESAIAINPDYTTAVCNYGIILVRLERFDEAEIYLRRGIELDPSNPHVLATLGALYCQKGRIDQGADCYERALRLNPQFGLAHRELGICARRPKAVRGRHRSFPGSGPTRACGRRRGSNLAIALYKSGQIRESLVALRKPCACTPTMSLAFTGRRGWRRQARMPRPGPGTEAVGWGEMARQIVRRANADDSTTPWPPPTPNRVDLTLRCGRRSERVNLAQGSPLQVEKIRAASQRYRESKAIYEPPSTIE